MAALTARDRQPVAIITNAAAPEVDTDEVAKILAVLDAALLAYRTLKPLRAALGRYTGGGHLVTLFANNHKHAEYALTLWASAHQLETKRHTSKYDNGTQIRWLDVFDGGESVLQLLWPPESQPVEPPTNVIADAGAAIREALRAPHWTDDKTLTDEERASRERMEAGHA